MPYMNQRLGSTHVLNASHPNGEEEKRSSTGRWLAILLLLLLPCWLLTSCATLDGPPASGYDANPPSDAIVGMWTHNSYTTGEKFTNSLLFNSDGTGISRGNLQNFPLTWKYDGDGWWTVTKGDHTIRYRVTPALAAGGGRALYMIVSDLHWKYTRMQ
jgi:hypothetical protein